MFRDAGACIFTLIYKILFTFFEEMEIYTSPFSDENLSALENRLDNICRNFSVSNRV